MRTLRINDDLVMALKRVAKDHGLTLRYLTELAVRRFLEMGATVDLKVAPTPPTPATPGEKPIGFINTPDSKPVGLSALWRPPG